MVDIKAKIADAAAATQPSPVTPPADPTATPPVAGPAIDIPSDPHPFDPELAAKKVGNMAVPEANTGYTKKPEENVAVQPRGDIAGIKRFTLDHPDFNEDCRIAYETFCRRSGSMGDWNSVPDGLRGAFVGLIIDIAREARK